VVHIEERSDWTRIEDMQNKRILDLERMIKQKISDNNTLKNRY